MSIVYEEDLVRDADGNLRDKDGNLLEKDGVWIDRNVRLRSRKEDAEEYKMEQQQEKELEQRYQRETERLQKPSIVTKFVRGIKKFLGPNQVTQKSRQKSR